MMMLRAFSWTYSTGSSMVTVFARRSGTPGQRGRRGGCRSPGTGGRREGSCRETRSLWMSVEAHPLQWVGLGSATEEPQDSSEQPGSLVQNPEPLAGCSEPRLQVH